jgi:hypothetical protein
MRDFALLQLVCIFLPAVLAVVIWSLAAFVQSGERKVAVRFRLASLLLLMPVIGGVLLLGKAAQSLDTSEKISVCLLSAFTVPFIWWIQLLIDNWREERRLWAAERALLMRREAATNPSDAAESLVPRE